MRVPALAIAVICACRGTPGLDQNVDAVISGAMTHDHLVGVGVAIVVDDRIVFARGYGVADQETHEPVTNDTRFRLASISKVFTAVAAMQLAEAGQLDLDQPVQAYVPTFPQKPWPVTSRELLAHTSGIRHYRGREVLSTKHYTDLTTPLEIFEADPLLFEPGTQFAYSSYGYNLLGAVVEAAGHEPFGQRVHDHVFMAARMSGASVEDITQHVPHAGGYVADARGEIKPAPPYDPSNKVPSGGFIATASDLANLAIAMDQDRLVKPETKRAMESPQHVGDRFTSFGLGFELGTYDGAPAVFHTGGQPGVSDVLYMVPAKHLAVVVLTNGTARDITAIARAVLDKLPPG
jgi:serine beta-lactamase-like protein LACTB